MFSYLDQDHLTAPHSAASKELAKMRAQLAQEESDLAQIEEHVDIRAAHLGYLHAEYTANRHRVEHYFEPRLRPLQHIVYASAEKCKLVEMQLAYLERKIVAQDRKGGTFIEVRDMREAAEELMTHARSALLRSYEMINNCPEDKLKTISNYDSPPDEALETMYMVMRLRGEPDCSWTASQVFLSSTYFTVFFSTRSDSLLKTKDMLEEELMEELEQYCLDATHAVPVLYQSSQPIGCLGQWLHAVRDYYRVKMVTAPVLLHNTAFEYAQQVIALARRIVFDDYGLAKKKGAARSTTTVATTSAPEDEKVPPKPPIWSEETGGAPKHKVPMNDSELSRVDADVVHQYAKMKQRMKQSACNSIDTQEELVKLRHRLNQLRADAAVAEEEMQAVASDLQAEMSSILADYDGTMIPVQYEIEDKTSELLERLANDRREKALVTH